jgi:hypothetical protein
MPGVVLHRFKVVFERVSKARVIIDDRITIEERACSGQYVTDSEYSSNKYQQLQQRSKIKSPLRPNIASENKTL